MNFQSTACITGALALYMEAKSSRDARDMLTIYSKPIYDTKNDERASVLQQGTGLINVYNSITSTTLVTPIKISLKESPLLEHQHLNIQNNGKEKITYNLIHLPAISVNGYNGNKSVPTKDMKFSHSTAIVRFVKDKITVPPGRSVKAYFTISPPKDLIQEQRWFYSGFIQVQSIDQSEPQITIPYGKKKNFLIFFFFRKEFVKEMFFLNITFHFDLSRLCGRFKFASDIRTTRISTIKKVKCNDLFRYNDTHNVHDGKFRK